MTRGCIFSWYGGDFTTDAELADAEPERRANPSIASFGASYLDQQRKRLPTHKFRRLHLNLPGAPDGAAFNGDKVMAAIVAGRRSRAREDGRTYVAFVDMSGGSSDDAVLGVAHYERERRVAVLDALMAQAGRAPFNPRDAVRKFAAELKEAWRISRVVGDAYAGQTFRADFEALGIAYQVSDRTKSEIYEAFEPRLNASEVELLDDPKLQEQLLTLVFRGSKIDHLPGDHDDYANAACGAIGLATRPQTMVISDAVLQEARSLSRHSYGNWGPRPAPQTSGIISGPLALARERRAIDPERV